MRYSSSLRNTVRAVASGTLDINYFLRILRKAVASENQGRTKKKVKPIKFFISKSKNKMPGS